MNIENRPVANVGGRVADIVPTPKPLIEILEIVPVTGTTERFVAKDRFKLKHDGGICSDLSSNFQSWFLSGNGKIEDPIPAGELRCGKLGKSSANALIIDELGGEAKIETTLTEMFERMEVQKNKEEGVLRTNNLANIFYIRDQKGVLRTVYIFWYLDGWSVRAYVIEVRRDWYGNSRVFSRNSMTQPSEPLETVQA